jgi:hypothetical protein
MSVIIDSYYIPLEEELFRIETHRETGTGQ